MARSRPSHKVVELAILDRGYIEIMENKMETTIVYRGYRVYRFWIVVSIFFSITPI